MDWENNVCNAYVQRANFPRMQRIHTKSTRKRAATQQELYKGKEQTAHEKGSEAGEKMPGLIHKSAVHGDVSVFVSD